MACPFSGAGEGRATYDEGAFAWEDADETLVGCVEDLVTKIF